MGNTLKVFQDFSQPLFFCKLTNILTVLRGVCHLLSVCKVVVVLCEISDNRVSYYAVYFEEKFDYNH